MVEVKKTVEVTSEVEEAAFSSPLVTVTVTVSGVHWPAVSVSVSVSIAETNVEEAWVIVVSLVIVEVVTWPVEEGASVEASEEASADDDGATVVV